MAKEKPVFTVRAGKIQGSVFRNESTNASGQVLVNYSVRIVKSYKDEKTGEWKETDYFFPDELPKVELVCRRCYGEIVMKIDK